MVLKACYPWFDRVSEKLTQVHADGRLPHGLLLVAPKDTGKSDFAQLLAKSLLCKSCKGLQDACDVCKSCQLFESKSHPDFYWIDRLTDTKGKQKKSIGIDQIRALNAKLSDTAQLGGWRIAIVSSVLAMTTASFNALLKTLEEPGQQTLLILLADNVQRVPATIRSRCQIIKPELDTDMIAQWLAGRTANDRSEIDDAIGACYGAPLAAEHYLHNSGAQIKAETYEQLDAILTNNMTPAEFLSGTSMSDAMLVDSLCDYFYQVNLICSKREIDRAYRKIPAKLPVQLYAKLIEYNRAQYAGSNLQPKLQFEAILIQWFEVGRKINSNSRG